MENKQRDENVGKLVPKMPVNFSWVMENKLAGLGFPNEDSNLAYLLEQGITRLITLMENRVPDTNKFPELHNLAIKVVDFTPPTLEQIEKSIDYIEESFTLNKAVGIHCAYGKGRTGTLISCFLVKHYNLDPDEAIEKLRSMRPGSVETTEQEDMVRKYAEHIGS